MGETSKYREYFAKYTQGRGIDIGAGGDPINNTCIIIDNADTSLIANAGGEKPNILANAGKLDIIQPESLDYVYSSHCLEDFEDTENVLYDWANRVKTGGYIALLLPNQKRYVEHCKKHGSNPNPRHKVDMSIEHMYFIASRFECCWYRNLEIVESKDFSDYNFMLVMKVVE